MNRKLYVLKRTIKEKGFLFAFKKVILFLLRPFSSLTKRSNLLIELRYGIVSNLQQRFPFFRFDSKMINLPKSKLVEDARYFWYANIPGELDLDGEKISRKDIFIYGGPNPKFTCSICQKAEWLSRIRQKNLFVSHNCSQSKECEELCRKHGDDLYTHFHQNFDFSIGCNPNLPAPRCLCIMPEDKNSEAGGYYQKFQNPGCDQWMLVFKRRLAFSCQIDVCRYPVGINWEKYDFVFVPNKGFNKKFSRPKIPIIMYGHDFWPLENRGFQWMIDWLEPDILLTAYPGQWKEYFKFPQKAKIAFYSFFDSLFFARPNINKKDLDLTVVGSLSSSVYKSRISLTDQISKLTEKYKISFSQNLPLSASWRGGTDRVDPVNGTPIRYLNKWSEYLGSAKYVIFGKMKYPVLNSKYYEFLGSGAIPIFPEAPDLKLLGIKPFEHYIPLSDVEKDNEKLSYYLDNYDKYKYIAENAVNWYKKVSDKMIFNDFEDVIREATGYKYLKRLI